MPSVSSVDLILQYALLVAGNEDDYLDRQLGPIHLIKYVYLADLAFADRNNGESFTGIKWQFYKFGPWSQAVNERINPALVAIGAIKTERPSDFGDKSEWVRWGLTDERRLHEISTKLPFEITSKLKFFIHRFGQDTASLLQYVYQTPPMVGAAPNEFLDFTLPRHLGETCDGVETLRCDSLTEKKKKRLKDSIKKLRLLRVERRAAKQKDIKFAAPVPPPRYDEVYFDGLEWLEDLAGPDMVMGEKEAIFSDDVWKSITRRDKDVS